MNRNVYTELISSPGLGGSLSHPSHLAVVVFTATAFFSEVNMQHVMPDGNTAALATYQLEQDRLYQEWEANEPQREYEIQQKTEELMHNEEYFMDAFYCIEESLSHKELLLCVENKQDAELGKKIRTLIVDNLNDHARKIVEDA